MIRDDVYLVNRTATAPEVVLLPMDIDLEELEGEDAAAIRDGVKHAYGILVIEQRADQSDFDPESWHILATESAFVCDAGLEGIYKHPRNIPDQWLREYAVDAWASAFGFQAGDRVTAGVGGEEYVIQAIASEPWTDGGEMFTGEALCTYEQAGVKSKRPIGLELLVKA